MHIAFCNNAPVKEARSLFAAGEYPEQKLWGAPELERGGHKVSYVDVSGRSPILERLSEKLRWRLGELPTERALLGLGRKMSGVDLFYAGAEQTLAGLALLRRVGLCRKPVVCVYHNPPRPLMNSVALGYDLAFALTKKAYSGLLAAGRTPNSTVLIPWGPQMGWVAYRPTGRDYLISCGKSSRDIDTLACAATQLNTPTVIYCSDGWHPREANVTPNLTLRRFSRVVSYPDVIADMAGAFAVAIPLARTDRAVALSELADAFALGKPVIVTRSDYIDFNVEDIGCGITVNVKDIDGWTRAIARLDGDRALAAEMGARGKSFAEQHWSAAIAARLIRSSLEERFDHRAAHQFIDE